MNSAHLSNRLGLVILMVLSLTGCGVRGSPQPPLTPPEIGRGQPTFRRATEQFKFQNVPPIPSEPEEDDDDAEEGRSS